MEIEVFPRSHEIRSGHGGTITAWNGRLRVSVGSSETNCQTVD